MFGKKLKTMAALQTIPPCRVLTEHCGAGVQEMDVASSASLREQLHNHALKKQLLGLTTEQKTCSLVAETKA